MLSVIFYNHLSVLLNVQKKKLRRLKAQKDPDFLSLGQDSVLHFSECRLGGLSAKNYELQ